MRAYKLTHKDDQTYNGCQWGENTTHTTSGEGNLCSPGWIHFYTDPLLAVLLNPIHGSFNTDTMHLWEGKCKIEKEDRGLKHGTTQFTTIKQIKVPKISMEQTVTFGILCALEVYKDKNFVKWAKNWLNNKDRTSDAANAAHNAAYDAAYAIFAAAYAAAYAAYAAYAAADVTYVAADVTYATAHATDAAVNVVDCGIEIDLKELARKAMIYK